MPSCAVGKILPTMAPFVRLKISAVKALAAACCESFIVTKLIFMSAAVAVPDDSAALNISAAADIRNFPIFIRFSLFSFSGGADLRLSQ